MIITSAKEISIDRRIVFENPDAPFGIHSYGYHVRSRANAMDQLIQQLQTLNADRFLLLTDSGVPAHAVQRVCESLATVAPTSLHLIAGTEHAKNLLTVATIGDEAIQAGVTRSSVIVALGGGLVGNLAGLLASLLYRGAVRLVHLPTTFLAMSDSCLSLKQGVNSAFGKNHYGQFKAPVFVWCDLSWLQTLPPAEIRAALCELIKNVLAITPKRYDEVLTLLRADASYSQQHLARFLEICLEAKVAVMQNDAHETHRALVLEYGHTIGHAIEILASGTDHPISHGLAIGMGLSIEAEIAFRLDLLSQRNVQAHEYLLQLNQMPPFPSFLQVDALMQILRQDNKRGYLSPIASMIDMVLLTDLGVPSLTGDLPLVQVDEALVRTVLQERLEGRAV